MKTITRRQFGVSAAVVAATAVAGVSLPQLAFAVPDDDARRFPQGFRWGCATAAYQIEGGAADDARGPSIWDTFSHTPGKTFLGETGDVADDSYHRYKEDVQLLSNLGVSTYRMSLSWSRIFPSGIAPVNPKGMDYYNRVIDELLKHNITPYVTLFHWDLPQALPGGWQSHDTAKAFADYAAYVANHLSDRVHHFMTTNEFLCFTDLGYGVGQFAPGVRLPAAQVNQVRHHGILAHGLGVQAIRANAASGTEVGLAENATVFVPIMETAEHIAAAQRATRVMNAPFLNVYTPQYVRADASPRGFVVEKPPASYPHMASPWLTIGPECIYWAVRNVSELWKPPALYITENGCSSDDVINADGRIDDTDRVMYLRNHLTHLHRAAVEGYPIKGYFLWSLMDNFEWADGYSKRFGIHYVDFKTLKRTPKQSAEWYRAVIAQNEVL
jgi:beta-glucosidase